jgi:hypothetical protein
MAENQKPPSSPPKETPKPKSPPEPTTPPPPNKLVKQGAGEADLKTAARTRRGSLKDE